MLDRGDRWLFMRSVQSEILPTLEPTPVAIELALNLHRSLRVTLAVVRQGRSLHLYHVWLQSQR